jgi:hypothetical protein
MAMATKEKLNVVFGQRRRGSASHGLGIVASDRTVLARVTYD